MNDWLEKIKEWFLNVGKLIFEFTHTLAAKTIQKYDDDIMAIIVQVALKDNLSGQEKFDLAVSMLMEKVPEMALYVAQTAIQMAYAVYKEGVGKDANGNGIPDYLELKKTVED